MKVRNILDLLLMQDFHTSLTRVSQHHIRGDIREKNCQLLEGVFFGGAGLRHLHPHLLILTQPRWATSCRGQSLQTTEWMQMHLITTGLITWDKCCKDFVRHYYRVCFSCV